MLQRGIADLWLRFMGSGVGLKEMVVRGYRVVEKDDGDAEVGSWLRREVVGCVGGAGGCLRLWFGFWLERGARWIRWTNYGGLERLCGLLRALWALRLLGVVDLKRKSMPDR